MRRFRISPFTLVWVALIVILILRPIFGGIFTKSIDISKAITLIQNDRVDEASINGDTLFINDVTNSGNVTYKTGIPKQLQDSFYKDYLKEKVESGKIKFTAIGGEEEGLLKTILPYAFMGILFFFMMNMIFRQTGSQNKEMNNFAKSKAKLFNKNDKEKVTFKDVAGLEEEKVELYEIVDFLKNPAKYARMGARIPRGVLLVGPPGTGKTYISRAVAGEAGVPFFSISGSEFLEMFVGVGASRVRDLFDVAKKNAPCIVFIDEIDAVGRKRGSGLGGGHDEREQTLNQLLVEMDGFEKNEGIIMMAATNRPDILDDALLRPGRFDRRVTIGLPDVKGREEILNIHTKDKPMAADVDIKNIAKRTPGFTPADLENLVNEAAILSARHGQSSITKSILEEASIKVLAGPEKTSTVITPDEKKLVSFHEAGHAIVTKSLPDTDPVQMVTIVPRGSAGGFTYTVPEEEKYYYTKSKMINEIIILLAGRAAEELKLEDISTGASNDIERATKIAHAMVSKYGMTSAIGTLDFTEDNENIFIGNAITHSKNVSEETLKLIDSEMKRIVDGCYEKAKQILRENDDKLTRLANCLIEKETVYKKEFEAIYNGDYDPNSFEDEKINIF
ncbi:ATP-dependent zinc metalloprotease FtsH [Ezakiella coagulans]|uniref:ATP-dependent zinc metalloprotease FtsH n=1 Tax=Ezakiella coagulans TaxID=46507 RepID=UPI00288AB2ED|nr:ATP-dependent zinc metalloprotease FtsH [Ezakiella coagulans]